jgi:hypothetical protein
MLNLETAAEYLFGIITENEEVKKFPKEFLNESIKWVKSWFLTPEDPISAKILTNPNKSESSKKDIIEAKLENLQGNAVFMKELEEKLQLYAVEKRKSFNVIDETELNVAGSFRQGNTGGVSNNDADDKNVIKRSKITVGGDFRQGDDIQQGHSIVNNHHHYVQQAFDKAELAKEFVTQEEVGQLAKALEGFYNTLIKDEDKTGFFSEIPLPPTFKGEKAPPQYQSLKSELKALVSQNKTPIVFNRLLDHLEQQDEGNYNTVLLLFGQFNRLNEKENSGLVSFGDANIERNRLNNALIATIDGLNL